MEYSYSDMLIYLLIYSFLGWLVEVSVIAVREKRFCNRGFFNLPLCLSYGIIMDILIVLVPAMGEDYILQFITVLTVSSITAFLSGSLAKRISRNILWKYDENNLFSGDKGRIPAALLMAAVYVLVLEIIHPVLFILVNMLPERLVRTVCGVIGILLLLDFMTILYAVYRNKNREQMEKYQKKRQQGKTDFGEKIYRFIWRRIEKAYPNMERMSEEDAASHVFAKGICFDKLVWVFLICAFIGDLIETLFCRLTAGVWMSRSSVIYGPFSIVWGIGAAILTVVLQRLADKEDRHIFFAGCLIGGVYEYMCSVFTEVFLGTVFWDYSEIPFNIDGRINLLYCFFWGLLSVVWIKICYPRISVWIEKIPPLAGKIATWILLIFMCCNALLSAAAMIRYTERKENKEAENAVELFLDHHYDDRLIEWVWPNMKIE